MDGFSRLAYTKALEDEKAATTIGFFSRARVFFTARGITGIHRVVTGNGANYAGVGLHPHFGPTPPAPISSRPHAPQPESTTTRPPTPSRVAGPVREGESPAFGESDLLAPPGTTGGGVGMDEQRRPALALGLYMEVHVGGEIML